MEIINEYTVKTADEKLSIVYDCLDRITDALVEIFETECNWELDGNIATFICKEVGNNHKIILQMKTLFSKYLKTFEEYGKNKNVDDTNIKVILPFTVKSLTTGETINEKILKNFEINTKKLSKAIFRNNHLNEGVMNFFRHNVGKNKMLRGLSYVLRFFLMTISSLAFQVDLLRWDYDQIVVEMIGPECMAIKQLATDNMLDKCIEKADGDSLILSFNTNLNPRYTKRLLKFTKDLKNQFKQED